jgi:hypothetical protein
MSSPGLFFSLFHPFIVVIEDYKFSLFVAGLRLEKDLSIICVKNHGETRIIGRESRYGLHKKIFALGVDIQRSL